MSRIGKVPVNIPDGVKIDIKKDVLEVGGPRGKLFLRIHPSIKVKEEDGKIKVERLGEGKEIRALHGLTRTLIYNLIVGITQGYKKELEVVGVGYSAKIEGKKLSLQVGYSRPVYYEFPEGVSINVKKEKNFIISIEGNDKQKVGEVAAEIRRIRPPEPYKGKGIRYKEEYVHIKAGKKGVKSQ